MLRLSYSVEFAILFQIVNLSSGPVLVVLPLQTAAAAAA